MCNLYTPASAANLARQFAVAVSADYRPSPISPRARGWFVRQVGTDRELVDGQWGLIPWFAKIPKLTYSTNNARSEELAEKASFKQPWARGQRCIIPAASFWEPCWESGKNVWWSFARADGDAFGLAGLWNTWVDRESGEMHESYTMLTINADTHPIMRRMHKPDPKLPADQQDKRMVVVLEPADWSTWLQAPIPEASALLRMADAKLFAAEPDPEKKSGSQEGSASLF
jgi:putative SOS response-associated peptidase YedK